MAVIANDVAELKKELSSLRRINSFYSFNSKELTLDDYISFKYKVSDKVSNELLKLETMQFKDVFSLVKSYEEAPGAFIKANDNSLEEIEEDEGLEDDFDDEHEKIDVTIKEDENYFNAQDLELSFKNFKFESYHNISLYQEVEHPIMQDLCKIFKFEINRIENEKLSFNKNVLIQKINKVYERLEIDRLSEATVLMSRFYSENKQNNILGYLYFEMLYAKYAFGSQKALSKARDVANTVCFLTDKNNDELLSYYRYMYVCREFHYDEVRALQLFRDFVLLNPDRSLSNNAFKDIYGVQLKSLLLFMKFDHKNWNIYEIESIAEICQKTLAGGILYLSFVRKMILPHLKGKRFERFINMEMGLYNLFINHKQTMEKIKGNFSSNGLVKETTDEVATVGQKFLQLFFLSAKLPTFSDFLSNTSINGTQVLEETKNDEYIKSKGITELSLWRMWVSKLTFEPSLQRVDCIPIDQVIKEADILNSYARVINKVVDFEKEIKANSEYLTVKERLSDINQKNIASVILGSKQYRAFDYGVPWSAQKEYYTNMLSVLKFKNKTLGAFIKRKAKKGMFWNLEELQLTLESISLLIDHKTLGLKARIEDAFDSETEMRSQSEYMSLSEHLSIYWWLYVLLISLIVVLFRLLLG